MAVALAVVAVLMTWPLYNIFAPSLIDNRSGALTLANFARILGHPAYQGALVNSLIVGAGGMNPPAQYKISFSRHSSERNR